MKKEQMMQKQVEVKLMSVTPKMAQSWLNNNPYNRKVNAGNVRKMKEDMLNGKWKQCIEPIAFDVEGNLCNGQHRLLALIASKKTHNFVVVNNLSKEDFATMDIGCKRTPADALTALGVKYAKTKANVIKKVFGLRSGKWVATSNGDTNFTASGKGGSIQVRTKDEYFDKKDMYDAIVPYFLQFDKAYNRKPSGLTTTDICGFMVHLYENGVSFEETNKFFSHLLDMCGNEKRNVVCIKLYETLNRHYLSAKNGTEQKKSPKYIQSLVAKGWNLYNNGVTMKMKDILYLTDEEFKNGVHFQF